MKSFYVKITKCDNNAYWYYAIVGSCWEVCEVEDNNVYGLKVDIDAGKHNYRVIDKNDCNSFDKQIKLNNRG